MIEIPFAICFAITLFAGLYDLKTSDVFEEIPALLISFGLFYWYLVSMIYQDLFYVALSILIGLIFLIFGISFYKLRIWGDGDAWIMGGIGFMIPYLTNLTPYYPIEFIFNLLVVGGIYSLLYILFYGLIKKAIRKNFFNELKKYSLPYSVFFLICVSLPTYLMYSGLIPSYILINFILVSLLPLVYLYAKVVESGMKRKVKPTELKEGDVLAGKEIKGLTKLDIKNLVSQGKLIEVQSGVHFTMVFSITLFLLYVYGGIFGLLF